ncbi:MAG TPA: FAD-dependent oxidoreductase [Caldilineaceae bacterium]|nr:FAD-dependent oxidoreductase [Caldilineaceae bacterium]
MKLEKTRLVIIGAGIVGAAAAYHLAQLGWRDILVLDKGNILNNDGSTSHAPGGVVALSHSKLMTQFAQYGAQLYSAIAPFTPQLDQPMSPYGANRNTYNVVGGLDVAIGAEKWLDLVRLEGKAKAFGVEAYLLSPQETHEQLPLLDPKAIRGSIYVPSSALAGGAYLANALLRDAAKNGAVQVMGDTPVTDIEVQNGRVVAVQTANPDLSRIACEAVLLCTNIWGPILGEKLGVPIPLMPCEHQYAFTEPLPALARFNPANQQDEVIWPTARIQDIVAYFRQHWNCYGIGNYWHKSRLVAPQALGRTAMNPFTPDDLTQCWEQAQRIFPAFQGKSITQAFNGIFAFPVDGYPLLGEVQGIRGLWTALGSWLTHAGGVGKAIAEWMTHGESEWDLRQVHLHRFHDFQNTPAYLQQISDKNYREVWDPGHPRQPLSEPRNVRLSPFSPRLDALGAVYTTFAGLELANWHESNAELVGQYADQIPAREGFAAAYWSPIQGAEHLATRNNVALFDLTGLSIIEINGSAIPNGSAPQVAQRVVDFLNYLCTNQMDKPVGSVIYTCWLSHSGGIRRDLAVARLETDRYWLFVGEGTRMMDLAWVRQIAAEYGDQHGGESGLTIIDRSDSYTALGLWGPNARKVLTKVTHSNVENDAFPYFRSRWIDVGYARVLALRVSYAGELGWELHIPTDAALPVWDAIWNAGEEYDLIAAGQGAFDSLRLEKGYRLWGTDIYTEYTPYQAGMGWTVRYNKGDFVGRAACEANRQKPLKKQLICLTATAPDAMAFGYEPVFHNDTCIGHITSANYGYSVGRLIAYAYLPVAQSAPGTPLAVEYLGTRWPAVVSNEPLWDPTMARLKG